MAGEGRADELLVDHRLLGSHLRLGILEFGRVAVERRLAHHLRLDQLLVPVIGDLRQLRVGLERMQLGDVVLGPQLQQ